MAEKAKCKLVDFDLGLEDGVTNVLWTTKGNGEYSYIITFADGSQLQGRVAVL